MNPTEWSADQIKKLVPSQSSRNHFNPRPAGLMRDDSATSLIYAFLKKQKPNIWFCESDLHKHVDKSRSAISWGLLFLRSQNLVRTKSADQKEGCQERYLVYQYAPEPILRVLKG